MTKINLQQMFAAKMDDLESLFHEFDGDRKDEFITKYPDIWDEVYDIMEESRYHRAMKSILKAGHEAASAFWLPLIEKAVEMAEVYALENDPDFIDRCLDEAIEMRNKNPHSKEVFGNAIIGKKAREFLLSIRETVADESELKKGRQQ